VLKKGFYVLNILYISHRIPYPPNKGDKIRSFNEIRHLAQNHDLHLAFLVDDPADVQHVEALREYCIGLDYEMINPRLQKFKVLPQIVAGKALSVPYFYSKRLQVAVDRQLASGDVDAVVCFSGPMAEYVLKSNALNEKKRPTLIMDFCDVDSDKWGQYAVGAKGPMKKVYALEQRRMLAYEGLVNQSFDHSIFITKQEAQLFQRLYPAAKKLQIVGNGVDFAFFDPATCTGEAAPRPRAAGPVLVFTGAMDYHANVDAVTWFCNEVFPGVEKEIGGEFCIVGSKPAPAVRDLEKTPGVRVTGFVEDIRPWYSRADISVLPLRLARGVQNKLIEAMAMEKAVVTSTKAAEAIGAISGRHLVVADTAEELSRAILELHRNPELRKTMGKEARRFVVEHFDWRKNMEKLESLLVSTQGHKNF